MRGRLLRTAVSSACCAATPSCSVVLARADSLKCRLLVDTANGEFECVGRSRLEPFDQGIDRELLVELLLVIEQRVARRVVAAVLLLVLGGAVDDDVEHRAHDRETIVVDGVLVAGVARVFGTEEAVDLAYFCALEQFALAVLLKAVEEHFACVELLAFVVDEAGIV